MNLRTVSDDIDGALDYAVNVAKFILPFNVGFTGIEWAKKIRREYGRSMDGVADLIEKNVSYVMRKHDRINVTIKSNV